MDSDAKNRACRAVLTLAVFLLSAAGAARGVAPSHIHPGKLGELHAIVATPWDLEEKPCRGKNFTLFLASCFFSMTEPIKAARQRPGTPGRKQ